MYYILPRIITITGEEGFDMTRKCYDWLDAQDREEGKEVILIAAEIANVSFTKDILDEQRAEYCSYSEEEKQIMYKEITGPLVDKFASMCSSYKTRKQCSHFENFLDCGLTLMEKMSAEKKCVISEFKK
ncbi:uncharacterized protein CEXT_544801 [Caerostris extrusa]|uniref:DUF19 domain-containing protein n=1 Tax=Caerostris extrusa TaxID=172846 RepID=A0AAV4TKL8_CAEEX|nr:uncharacterized protein CEXT_544801 [Caerostris extrusa]